MMSCEEYISKINEFIDGESGTKLSDLMNRHYKACPSCRKETDEIILLKTKLGKLHQPLIPPAHIWTSIEASLPDRKSRKMVPSLRYLVAMAVMIALLLPFLVLYVVPDNAGNKNMNQSAVKAISVTMDQNTNLIKNMIQADRFLDEKDKSLIMQNLEIINHSWNIILKLSQTSPQNKEIWEAALNLYKQQLFVLETTIKLTQSNEGRKI